MKRAATLSAKVMDNYFRGRLETVIEDVCHGWQQEPVRVYTILCDNLSQM
jgi:hypothetical protein